MKTTLTATCAAIFVSVGFVACGASDGPATDSDGDGLTDTVEQALRTNPHDRDTDDDGLEDGDEIDAKTDPRRPDSDGDGVLDGRDRHHGHNDADFDDWDGNYGDSDGGVRDGFDHGDEGHEADVDGARGAHDCDGGFHAGGEEWGERGPAGEDAEDHDPGDEWDGDFGGRGDADGGTHGPVSGDDDEE